MNQATAVFSLPWSDRTRCGNPYCSTALMNRFSTVCDSLLELQLRKTGIWLYPSIYRYRKHIDVSCVDIFSIHNYFKMQTLYGNKINNFTKLNAMKEN